jgi:alpha-aminoadipic semialdehyde synthase
MQGKKYHSILLIGSGLMCSPLLKELLKHGDTKITIASNLLKDAQALTALNPEMLSAVHLDVTHIPSLEALIGKHEHVISFIPPWMHTPICEACLKLGKNMITSSYISPDMEKMHHDVKSKGLIFLNECGLDPGIDIMGTMKIVHEAE